MSWYGPQTGECSCCGDCQTDEFGGSLCLDTAHDYTTIELEIPDWVSDGACSGCQAAVSGLFVLNKTISGAGKPLWEYENPDALAGCGCGELERMHVELNCDYVADAVFINRCCGWFVRMKITEHGPAGSGPRGDGELASRSISYLLDAPQTFTVGDTITLTQTVVDGSFGTGCACDLSGKPAFVRLHL